MDTTYLLGIDIGSTTIKAVIINNTDEIIYSIYQRHNAEIILTLKKILNEININFKNFNFKIAICGSGGEKIANYLNINFIQEVVANAIAVKEKYKNTKVAIELGGQDAKVIFFNHNNEGNIVNTDMRMNGVCAGGTGAFIDQIAELLDIKTEEFESLASKGKNIYNISGRCGVFAKTDIQPLLNQGVPKEDIALSSFHSIAKQTISGLAQGNEILPPVIFQGGPLKFNPTLIKVFKERLNFSDNQVIIPKNSEIFVAYGTALAINQLFKDTKKYNLEKIIKRLEAYKYNLETNDNYNNVFFKNLEEKDEFYKRHTKTKLKRILKENENIDIYIGIDGGSTTTKIVFIDENDKIIDNFYSSNKEDSLTVAKQGLLYLKDKYRKRNIKFNVKGVGTTGYGENLLYKAFKADYHNVETVSHAKAALKFNKDISFILDIGGQDMKAIFIKNNILTDIVLNEACSSGCGSFLETYAKSLDVKLEDIAKLAFKSKSPSRLGSRCTVFMNSSIITEQKQGKTKEDILAGLCMSIIENVFTKVVRINDFDNLGNVIYVQGGTFKNDAVLRALEIYTNKKVIRAPFPGEMGAYGVALLTKDFITKQKNYKSTFIGLENLENFSYTKKSGSICQFCTNNCVRSIIEFSDGTYFVTGNKCERGEIIGNISIEKTKKELKEKINKINKVPDVMKSREKLILKKYSNILLLPQKNITIGIPKILEFWNSLPFWKSFFETLGFKVILSDNSSYKIFEEGMKFIPSDTICFPSKLAHGHIENLAQKKVDRIFIPTFLKLPKITKKLKNSDGLCAVVQGSALMLSQNNDISNRYNLIIDNPTFRWTSEKLKDKQIIKYMTETFNLKENIIKKAIDIANISQNKFNEELINIGKEAIEYAKEHNTFAVLLAARPYHSDSLINHNISSIFTQNNIPILTIDSVPYDINDKDIENIMIDVNNRFHSEMILATLWAAKQPDIEVAQIISFGCGHDAINSDELARILNKISNKQLLALKVDEGEVIGPLNIRIKSFIETIKEKRKEKKEFKIKSLENGYKARFKYEDKKLKTILIPNLSEAFSEIATAVVKHLGYKAKRLEIADERAIELAKKYVHNDMCYPAFINTGEMLKVLEEKKYNPNEIAFGLAQNCEDCRAAQYLMVIRNALNSFGYENIPIVTTGNDPLGVHPGIKLGIKFQVRMLVGVAIIDTLQVIKRKIKPYEVNKGETKQVYEYYVKKIANSLEKGFFEPFNIFEKAVERFNKIETKQEYKPKVFFIGEILMNYHSTANYKIVEYLENNGLEVIMAGMVDFFRREVITIKEGIKKHHFPNPALSFLYADVTDKAYHYVLKEINKRMKNFKFYEKKISIKDLSKKIEGLVDKSYNSGETWLIPAEILEYAEKGVKSFIIVQPFGCLPNHVTGRGLIKPMKKRYPDIQILALDYDQNTSFANIENRLQMLIMNAK
ncbi:putative CoA-substrate-specific enzyme activase [Hypnocyclicus thermotrophus]|uniref:CoA-substrate-specific enzyme activase n=1 Tax=Hypnocyclicus thermotrophus TaxID=1627895 RepID=A0AA46E0G0_9FUSO|nr:acyl-CoA dehydratase activase [Hypnocyclicus thermotrophus]TDT72494.1 putative CoA-substrate-specific enzyme activase [Hypnocyclicus thermotrophus]